MAAEGTESIFLKKVDKKAYRKLKAVAAERGVPVYTLLNEVLAAYVDSQSKGSKGGTLTLEEIDNAAYSFIESDASLSGKWVAIANGKLIASAETREKATQLMRKEYQKSPFRHGILTRVGEPREEGEWLAGSIQSD